MSESNVVLASPRHAGRRVLLRAVMAMALVCSLAPQAGAAQGRGELPDFTELVEKVGPSVVNIRTLERSGRNNAAAGSGIDPNMEEFFKRFGIPLPGGKGAPRGGGEEEPQQRGVGSGFILSADG